MAKRLNWSYLKHKGRDVGYTYVNLNNRSRSGKFIKLKITSERYGIYRLDDNKSVVFYIDKFLNSLKRSEQLKSLPRTKRQKFVSEVKGKKFVDEYISKGMPSIEFGDPRNFNYYTLVQKHKDVLKPLVGDSQLLDVLSSFNNVDKYKHRLSYSIDILENGSPILRLDKTGVPLKTIQDDLNENLFKKGGLMKLYEKGYIRNRNVPFKAYDAIENVDLKVRMTFKKEK